MYFSRITNHQMRHSLSCNLGMLSYHKQHNLLAYVLVDFEITLPSHPHHKIFHNLSISIVLVYENIQFLFCTSGNAQQVDNCNPNFHCHPINHPRPELFHKIGICKHGCLRRNPFLHDMYCTSRHYHNISLRLQNMP